MDDGNGRTVVKKYFWKENNSPGAIYGLGFIGALVYYLTHATTFLMGVIGFIKAIFWPAVIVYKILEMWRL